ncbi:hypothetical protein [Vibrio ezurae]|uniref:Uncharacterized protein n=1 Tax=Vibrio ezurae NBRC 102218 TaxID=1219080 RepID=U3AKI6_9VIBR|nr:hypothetical protein [Vibrio ezurae]GAD80436.1 hypothetical protein VEZ01S_37_00010 [Vibrio ezurae NBRC 102218]
MAKFIRTIIKTFLIIVILIVAALLKGIIEDITQAKPGPLFMIIIFGGAGAAIRAIYKYDSNSSKSTELKLNKNE